MGQAEDRATSSDAEVCRLNLELQRLTALAHSQACRSVARYALMGKWQSRGLVWLEDGKEAGLALPWPGVGCGPLTSPPALIIIINTIDMKLADQY